MTTYGMVQNAVLKLRRRPSIVSYTRLSVHEVDKQWFLAASNCDLTTMKSIYMQDNDVINKKDFCSGYAALHWAARQGNIDTVSWLLCHNADVDIKSNGGYTPLHFAVQHGHQELIAKLIADYGADINVRDYSGKKPRHYLSSDLSPSIHMLLEADEAALPKRWDPGLNGPSTAALTYQAGVPRKASVNLPLDFSEPHEIEEQKRKKRTISFSQPFSLHRMYKERRSQTSIANWQRRTSEQRRISFSKLGADMLGAEGSSRKSSICISHPHFLNGDVIRSAEIKAQVDGYAGFISNNKLIQKRNSEEIAEDPLAGKQWNVNSWV